jgi:hypothetical protein
MNADLDYRARLTEMARSHVDLDNLMTTWRDARADTVDAYDAWRICGVADRAAAHSAYVAAADREAAAERLCVGVLRLRASA